MMVLEEKVRGMPELFVWYQYIQEMLRQVLEQKSGWNFQSNPLGTSHRSEILHDDDKQQYFNIHGEQWH